MNQTTPYFTFLDHTADLMVEIEGSSLVDLFENAGKALLHLMLRTMSIEQSDFVNISVSGDDLPDLMVRWLAELLYLFEGDGLVVTSISIDSLSSTELKATLGISPYDIKIHEVVREIKAVTYHQIEVTDENGVWKARVIFDL